MKIRLKDIANKLGISTTTVSLVLNNKPGISNETRKMVLEEIEKAGYKPSVEISNMKSIGNIRFVLFKGHGKVVAETPFFANLIESIDKEARNKGYDCLHSYVSKGDYSIGQVTQSIIDNATDGIILLATEMESTDVTPFIELNLPLLILDSGFTNINIDTVKIDNVDSIISVVNYLVSMGHKDIGYLHSSKWIQNFDERHTGYKLGLDLNNLEYKAENIIMLEPTLEGAHDDMIAYINSGGRIPKAVISDNDIIATGAISALNEKGYDIPNDVSIVGFDDLPYCTMLQPKLTTIAVNNYRMGILAVRRLVDNIESQNDEVVKILLETNFIKRQSVKNLS